MDTQQWYVRMWLELLMMNVKRTYTLKMKIKQAKCSKPPSAIVNDPSKKVKVTGKIVDPMQQSSFVNVLVHPKFHVLKDASE